MGVEKSRWVVERACGTIHAAEVLHARAPVIAHVCAKAVEGEVVMAVVEPECGVGDAWTVPWGQLRERDRHLARGSWSPVFFPHIPTLIASAY